MEIKYQKQLCSYKYLVMFDLASNITGVCLWDISLHRPARTDVIKTSGKFKTISLYDSIAQYFSDLFSSGICASDVLVYKEAMPTQLRGGASTIQTFISLAKSHAVLNLYLLQNNIDFYDDVGVYPASTKAYFKRLNPSFESTVTKEDVRDYVSSLYNLSCLSLDESDAVFLAMTFVDVKWDNDIGEAIREIKRHKKTLVSPSAKNEQDKKILVLSSLKIEQTGGQNGKKNSL